MYIIRVKQHIQSSFEQVLTYYRLTILDCDVHAPENECHYHAFTVFWYIFWAACSVLATPLLMSPVYDLRGMSGFEPRELAVISRHSIPTQPSIPLTQPTIPLTLRTIPLTQPTIPLTYPTIPLTQPTIPLTQPIIPLTQPTIPLHSYNSSAISSPIFSFHQLIHTQKSDYDNLRFIL